MTKKCWVEADFALFVLCFVALSCIVQGSLGNHKIADFLYVRLVKEVHCLYHRIKPSCEIRLTLLEACIVWIVNET